MSQDRVRAVAAEEGVGEVVGEFVVPMTTWGAFAAAEPELAAFVAERLRATVVAAANSDPADRYVLFELRPTEVRRNGYGDVTLPERRRWRADP